MNFLLGERKKHHDKFFISGEEKINEFVTSVEEKRRGVAEQKYKREAS